MPGDVIIENVDTEGLTKPATRFVERLSNFFAGAFEPYQIVRLAKAEAKADMIRAESEIEIAELRDRELRDRAFNRLVGEQIRKQRNLDAITEKVKPLVEDTAQPENVTDDWIANTLEKSQNVSDEQMQKLWARILAGEANNPGKFSRKTVNVLSDLDKADIELFTSLCRFVWTFDGAEAAPIDETEAIFSDHGITISSLTHLESLGLLRRSPLRFSMAEMPVQFRATYFERSVDLTLSDSAGNKLKTGSVILTAAGLQLGPLCDREPIDGFFDYMCELWKGDSTIESVEIIDGEQLSSKAKDSDTNRRSRPEIRESSALTLG